MIKTDKNCIKDSVFIRAVVRQPGGRSVAEVVEQPPPRRADSYTAQDDLVVQDCGDRLTIFAELLPSQEHPKRCTGIVLYGETVFQHSHTRPQGEINTKIRAVFTARCFIYSVRHVF